MQGDVSEAVAIYADGGLIRKNPSLWGGTWAWCAVDKDDWRVAHDSGLLLPAKTKREQRRGVETFITNNETEFYAVLAALEAMPYNWSGRVCSDSQVTLMRFFWRGRLAGISTEWEDRMIAAIERLGTLTPVLHDGHPTREHLAAGVGKGGRPVSHHQKWCDDECTRLARIHGLVLIAKGERGAGGEAEAEPDHEEGDLPRGQEADEREGAGHHGAGRADPPRDHLAWAAARG